MYAMINIERYQNVAVGDTVAECQDAYLQMLAQRGHHQPGGRGGGFGEQPDLG